MGKSCTGRGEGILDLGFRTRDGFRESLPSRSPVNGCEAAAVHGRDGGGARIGCLDCGEVNRQWEHQALPLPAVGRQEHGSRAADDPAHVPGRAMRQPSDPCPLRWASLPTWYRRFRSTPRRRRARCANGLRRQARRSPSPAGPKSRPRVSRRAALSVREWSRERPAAPLEPHCPRRERHCPAAPRFHAWRGFPAAFPSRARLSLPPPHAGIPAPVAQATAHRRPQRLSIGRAGGSPVESVCGVATCSTAVAVCSGCLVVLVAGHRDPDRDDGGRGSKGHEPACAQAAAPPRFRDGFWRRCASKRGEGRLTIDAVSEVLTCCGELATCERAVDPGRQRLGIQARTGRSPSEQKSERSPSAGAQPIGRAGIRGSRCLPLTGRTIGRRISCRFVCREHVRKVHESCVLDDNLEAPGDLDVVETGPGSKLTFHVPTK